MPSRLRVTRPTLFRLAAEAARDPKTVESVLEGRGNAQSREAVLAAARRLGEVAVVAFLAPHAAPATATLEASVGRLRAI